MKKISHSSSLQLYETSDPGLKKGAGWQGWPSREAFKVRSEKLTDNLLFGLLRQRSSLNLCQVEVLSICVLSELWDKLE